MNPGEIRPKTRRINLLKEFTGKLNGKSSKIRQAKSKNHSKIRSAEPRDQLIVLHKCGGQLIEEEGKNSRSTHSCIINNDPCKTWSWN